MSDTTNQLNEFATNEWTTLLLSVLLLAGLYFLQKYLYLFDRKLLVNSTSNQHPNLKPWPLWAGLLLGFSVFLHDVFSPNDFSFFRGDWSLFQWAILILCVATIGGLIVQSLFIFGTQKGLLRSFIYLALMMVYIYAGFISGLLVVGVLALFVLLFFIKYFKNQLTIK